MVNLKLNFKNVLLFGLFLAIADCKVLLNKKSLEYDTDNEDNDGNPCLHDTDRGPCFGTYTRFYYNRTDEKCKVFCYGGCKGNDNRFLTLEECEFTCIDNSWPPIPVDEDSGEKEEETKESDFGMLIYNPSETSIQDVLTFESEEDLKGWVASGVDIVEEELPPETTTTTTTTTTSSTTTEEEETTSDKSTSSDSTSTTKQTANGGSITTIITTKGTTSSTTSTTTKAHQMRELSSTQSSESTTDSEDETTPEPTPKKPNHVLVPNIDEKNGTLETVVNFTASISVELEFSLKLSEYTFKINDSQNEQNSWVYVELISHRPECNDDDQLQLEDEEYKLRSGVAETTTKETSESFEDDDNVDEDLRRLKKREVISIVKKSGSTTTAATTTAPAATSTVNDSNEEHNGTSSHEAEPVDEGSAEDVKEHEILPNCKDLNFTEERFELFDLNKYGFQFNEMSDWATIRFAFGPKSMKRGSYTLRFTLSSGTGNIYIDNITVTISPKMKNNTELYEEWLQTSTTTTTTITTTTDTENSTTTPNGDITTTTSGDSSNSAYSGEEAMSASASQIVLIVLLVVVSVALVGLSVKHWQTQVKLKEYRATRGAPQNFDNPLFSGQHTSADRYGSLQN